MICPNKFGHYPILQPA